MVYKYKALDFTFLEMLADILGNNSHQKTLTMQSSFNSQGLSFNQNLLFYAQKIWNMQR